MPEQLDSNPTHEPQFTFKDRPQQIEQYHLIKVDEKLFKEATDYLEKTQSNSSTHEAVFVPTGIGLLLTPGGLCFIFSMYGAGDGNIYDMKPLGIETIKTIETSQVLFCGVTTASFEGFKLLTHAGGPDAVKNLTARGLDLAIKNGATLNSPIEVSVYCNPNDGYDIYVNGPKGYLPTIENLGREMGVRISAIQKMVTPRSIITV